MPTIDVLFSDFEMLVGKKLPKDTGELTDILTFVKSEVASLDGEELSIEIKDGNRPDLWGVEGIARALRGALGIEEGLKQYRVHSSSGVEIWVDSRLKKIRPYIASALVRNVHITDKVIRGLMRLQEKLDQTYGRKRNRASIGLYNFGLIHPPLHYKVAKPTEIAFTPLGYSRKISLNEILEVHPKGLEYGHIIKAFKQWPILMDSDESILSFPPIINSDDLGKITKETKDILIEVTGTDHQTVVNTSTLMALSVADRGGDIFTTRVIYPYVEMREEVTPSFTVSEIKLELKLIEEILDLNLRPDDVIKLLKRGKYDARPLNNKSVLVKIPCYRFDVMHPIDIVEDIAIMYGYDNISPQWPQLITFGAINSSEIVYDNVREIMIGLGFQEILSFSMTNPQILFSKMNLKLGQVAEVVNPITERFTCLRSWVIPSLMEFLSNNTHVSYPQRIFEVGDCVVFDRFSKTSFSDVNKLACLSIHSKASFSEGKAVLEAFLLNFGKRCDLDPFDHRSFIEGRVGRISISGEEVGFIGEVNPEVLVHWGLENPTVGFEVDLNKLFRLKDR